MKDPLDQFISDPDVRERFERRIRATPEIVMQTAYEFDMQSIALIRLIIYARKFVLRGTAVRSEPKGLVQETREIGWGTLRELPGRLLICGSVCQPWLGNVKFTPVPADRFADLKVPDQVKIVWTLEAEKIEPGITLFAHEVRALATDAEARRKFKRYWFWARFGIIAIRLLLLPAIRRRAEREYIRQNVEK